jgi:HEPN domain-containing protein
MTDPNVGLDYLNMADDFRQAYRNLGLPDRQPLNWPRYFLATHAIELALKSYLLRHDASQDPLKGRHIRHDLEALLKKAEERGLKLETQTRRSIELLSKLHKQFRSRYSIPSGEPAITIEQCDCDLDKLLMAVSGAANMRELCDAGVWRIQKLFRRVAVAVAVAASVGLVLVAATDF